MLGARDRTIRDAGLRFVDKAIADGIEHGGELAHGVDDAFGRVGAVVAERCAGRQAVKARQGITACELLQGVVAQMKRALFVGEKSQAHDAVLL